jgi:hypothetical protein
LSVRVYFSYVPNTHNLCVGTDGLWQRIKPVAEEMGLIANLRAIDQALRNAGMRVFIAPHRRWEPGDYEDWRHPNPTQISIMTRHSFARGEWGGDWHPDFAPKQGDVVAKEHWGQSGRTK